MDNARSVIGFKMAKGNFFAEYMIIISGGKENEEET